MIETDRFAKVEVDSAAALRDWLSAHHGRSDSVWLVTWKKAAGARYLSVQDVLDELIAFGWIDGLRRKLDDQRTMQLISPRRHQVWTATYRDRAARLIAEGRMQPPGLAAIEAAKAGGTWEGLADVDALVIPDDLAAALDDPARFQALAPSYRRNVLRWLAQARTEATRTKRLGIIADNTARGVRIPQM